MKFDQGSDLVFEGQAAEATAERRQRDAGGMKVPQAPNQIFQSEVNVFESGWHAPLGLGREVNDHLHSRHGSRLLADAVVDMHRPNLEPALQASESVGREHEREL